MNVRKLLFDQPEAPEPTPEYVDYRLEWREGWGAGWAAMPAAELTYAERNRSRQLYGRGRMAYNAGAKAAREERKRRIGEVWPDVEKRARPHEQMVNNWPRAGVAYQGVFFFRYGTMKLPTVVLEET